jgi:hypothetical protein
VQGGHYVNNASLLRSRVLVGTGDSEAEDDVMTERGGVGGIGKRLEVWDG